MFDKPKVTIDLEEYQYLKQKVEQIESDSMNIAARKILWTCALVMNRGGTMSDVRSALKNDGVTFMYTPHATKMDTWESVDIKLEKVK